MLISTTLMIITIHRGTHEIGGSCIEIATDNSRILIDAGQSLDGDKNATTLKDSFPSTLSASLKKIPPFSGILISHPHLDHYGLLGSFSKNIPIYAGQAAAVLMKFSASLTKEPKPWKEPETYRHGETFHVGDFAVTPYLMDHSGFDSYGFLIETNGKRIFYSGDFRSHGRKEYAFERLINKPPADIDVLLMEGTTIGQQSAHGSLSEDELESDFIQLIKNTPGAVFVTMAGQNIDRIVTVFRAAKRSNRLFVIDPYVAEVLERLHEHSNSIGQPCNLPRASWEEVKVAYPTEVSRWLKIIKREEVGSRYLKYGVKWKYLSEQQAKIVMLVRASSDSQVVGGKYFDLSKARWIYSMWAGYLDRDTKMQKLNNKFKENGTAINQLHTSGHASAEAMHRLVDALQPRKIIPIHTAHPEQFAELFPNVEMARDGIPYSA